MGETLESVIREAWGKVLPRLEGDADELRHRLARRRSRVMKAPPQAWCLAVRACDGRIGPLHFEMDPPRPIVPEGYLDHTVTLTAKNLRWLCRPVSIPSPGVDWRDAAEMLGVGPNVMREAIRRKVFSVRYVAGLGGKSGNPVPVVYTRELVDPGSLPLGSFAFPEWGTHWRYVCDHIPPDVRQRVRRVPAFVRWRGRLRFRGWRFVCPGCRGRCFRLLYPVGALLRVDLWPGSVARDKRWAAEVDEVAPPLPAFACSGCHQVNGQGRLGMQGWNTLISHMTGGLLYGHEVRRPAWYVATRKREFVRRKIRSPMMGRVLALLLETEMTPVQMAKYLRANVNSTRAWVSRLYDRHGVGGREELRRKLGAGAEARPKAAG